MAHGPSRRLLLLVAPAWLGLSVPAHAQDASTLPSIGLRDALHGAQTHAPSVASADAARALAEAERGPTTAAYFPALTMSGSGGYTFDNQPAPALARLLLPDRPRIDSRSLIAKGEVSLEWTALDWSRGARADATAAAARAQGFTATAARHDAVLLAAERYIQSAAANALTKDAELALARRSEQERAIGELVHTGTRSPLDLERAKIETISARYELAARQRDELAACAALAAAIGRPATQPVCARRDDLAVFEPAPSHENDRVSGSGTAPALHGGASARPELQARAALVDARREEYDAAIAARLPTVGLAVNADLAYVDVRKGDGVDGHQYGGSALVYVRWSGLDPVTWSRAAPADAAVALAQSEWDAERQAVANETVATSHAVLRAEIELERAVAVMHAAETARDAQNGRYRAGLASMLELLDSENLAQQARRASIEAERDQQLASARLLWATGRIAALTP